MEQVLIINARRFDFENKNGERIAGCNLTYLVDAPIDEDNERGVEFYTAAAPLEVFDALPHLPAVCTLETRTVRKKDAGGKTVRTMVPVNAHVVELVELPFGSDANIKAVG